MAHFVNHARFAKPADHPSVSYLKQDDIGVVLSRALADLYVTKPTNQLHFLGHWLLNHAAAMKNKLGELEKEDLRENLKEKYLKTIQDQRDMEEKQIIDAEKKKEKDEELQGRIRNDLDVDDFLQEVVQYLKDQTGAAAGYIGKLERVKRQITLLDNEKAHIDDDAPWVIRYITASKGSEFMIDKTLTEEEGEATYSIWKEEEEPPAEEELSEEALAERAKKKDKLKTVCVDDVVNDSRIKFFDVPKLGAYFAVPLTYKSCLFEASFDAGVEDSIECRKLRAQQEEEKQKSEHASNREEEEEKVYDEILEAPYKTIDVKLVAAFDTLGQDRTFRECEKELMVDWVTFLKNEWERAENNGLKRDIDAHILQHFKDQQRLHDKQAEWLDEEKNVVEEVIKAFEPTVNEEFKQIEGQLALLELYRKRLLDEFADLFELKHYRVLKYARVLQLAFYLSQKDRDEIVEPRTNMINWKRSKKFLNAEFKEFLSNLKPKGSKPYKPPVYAKTMKLEKDLLIINFEDVQHYSLALSALYKFIEHYLKVRIMDVTYRRHEYNAKVDEREAAIKAAEELAERRRKHVDDAREAHEKELEALEEDAEKPGFDEARVLQEFDETESNRPIEIPPEIKPDEDGDIDWEETP